MYQKVVTSALCIIPPKELWTPIQEIRSKHDPAFQRWMPHINLLYPFVPEKQFDEAEKLLKEKIGKIQSFEVKFEKFGCFKKKDSILWLEPTSDKIQGLFGEIEKVIPSGKTNFTPHLTVGHFPNKEANQYLKKFNDGWKKVSFEVKEIYMISRKGQDDPFKIIKTIPLKVAQVKKENLKESDLKSKTQLGSLDQEFKNMKLNTQIKSEVKKEEVELIQKESLSSIFYSHKKIEKKENLKDFAKKRLMKDLQEIYQNPNRFIHAAPLEKNIFEWHVNLFPPEYSPYEDVPYHLTLYFTDEYPNKPPKVFLHTTVNRDHVFGQWICLDILESHHFDHEMYSGWSTSYTTYSILIQLHSYLFELSRSNYDQIKKCVEGAKKFQCTCKHDMTKNIIYPLISNGPYELGKYKRPLKVDSTFKKGKLDGFQRHSVFTEKNYIYLIEDLNVKPTYEKKVLQRIPNDKIEKINDVYYRIFYKKLEKKEKEKLIKINVPQEVMIEILSFLDVFELRRIFSQVPQMKNLSSPYIIERREVVCYHNKLTFEEDIIGYGLKVVFHPKRNDQITEVSSPLEFLSKTAFEKEFVRSSVWRDSFTHFLPLYIEKKHGERALKELETISTDPLALLQLLSKLMNTQIVQTMKGQVHASIKALDGYFYFHRLLIALTEKYPELLKYINQKVSNFIKEDKYRDKIHIDNMGEFLAYLSVSNYDWAQIGPYVMQETMTRNAQWIYKANPSFSKLSEENYIKHCFDTTKVSRSLLMFHVLFLKKFARPKGVSLQEIARNYDLKYGQSTLEEKEMFQKELLSLEKVSNFSQFFEKIQLNLKSPIVNILKSTYQSSLKKGYHTEDFNIPKVWK